MLKIDRVDFYKLWRIPHIVVRPKSKNYRCIENTTSLDNVVISKESELNWCDFRAGVRPKFNPVKSTCFKVISQVLLVHANAWPIIGENHSACLAIEFVD